MDALPLSPNSILQGQPILGDVGDARASEPTDGPTDATDALGWLPCVVSVDIPVDRFTVRSLSMISQGTVFSTACPNNSELPVYANEQFVGWSELEVIGEQLAVRITEIP